MGEPRGPTDADAEVDCFRRNPHDSVAALRSTAVPVLAVYGGDDFVVPPTHNVPKLREHLRAAGNRDFEVVVFPGAGHDLMLPGSTGPEEPYRWRRRPPGYLDTIFDWLAPRVAH